jgi:15-cis-phytoene desaturase
MRRLPGIDPSDFFNYGQSEAGWRQYCARVAQFRLQYTMRGQIQVGVL